MRLIYYPGRSMSIVVDSFAALIDTGIQVAQILRRFVSKYEHNPNRLYEVFTGDRKDGTYQNRSNPKRGTKTRD